MGLALSGVGFSMRGQAMRCAALRCDGGLRFVVRPSCGFHVADGKGGASSRSAARDPRVDRRGTEPERKVEIVFPSLPF